MSLIKWPFKRKTYPGLNNPRYVSDIQAANEAVLDAMKAIGGLADADFAIITGLNYTPGLVSGTGTYSPGIFYLNGGFYFVENSFGEGFYLAANAQDEMNKAFPDGNSRPIYTINYGTTSNVAGGNSPQFSNNMNQYRISSKYLAQAVLTLQGIAAGLGNASTKNVGTTAGTVAAGDDPRLVYTADQFAILFGGRIPAPRGATVYISDLDNDFATNLDGTGLGIVAPWIGWAEANGNNGTPNKAGKVTVGRGTYINPDNSTTIYAANATGGERLHKLTVPELPPLSGDTGNIAATGAGDGKIAYNGGGAGQGIPVGVKGADGNTLQGLAHNNMQPWDADFIMIKISD